MGFGVVFQSHRGLFSSKETQKEDNGKSPAIGIHQAKNNWTTASTERIPSVGRLLSCRQSISFVCIYVWHLCLRSLPDIFYKKYIKIIFWVDPKSRVWAKWHTKNIDKSTSSNKKYPSFRYFFIYLFFENFSLTYMTNLVFVQVNISAVIAKKNPDKKY